MLARGNESPRPPKTPSRHSLSPWRKRLCVRGFARSGANLCFDSPGLVSSAELMFFSSELIAFLGGELIAFPCELINSPYSAAALTMPSRPPRRNHPFCLPLKALPWFHPRSPARLRKDPIKQQTVPTKQYPMTPRLVNQTIAARRTRWIVKNQLRCFDGNMGPPAVGPVGVWKQTSPA